MQPASRVAPFLWTRVLSANFGSDRTGSEPKKVGFAFQRSDFSNSVFLPRRVLQTLRGVDGSEPLKSKIRVST